MWKWICCLELLVNPWATQKKNFFCLNQYWLNQQSEAEWTAEPLHKGFCYGSKAACPPGQAFVTQHPQAQSLSSIILTWSTLDSPQQLRMKGFVCVPQVVRHESDCLRSLTVWPSLPLPGNFWKTRQKPTVHRRFWMMDLKSTRHTHTHYAFGSGNVHKRHTSALRAHYQRLTDLEPLPLCQWFQALSSAAVGSGNGMECCGVGQPPVPVSTGEQNWCLRSFDTGNLTD